MRGWAVASWVALGLLLVSGVASAHPAGTTVTADDGEDPEVPAQTFDEAFCLPMCTTQAREQANLPPVIVTESGTWLYWETLGGYHTATSDTETGVDQDRIGATVALGTDTDGESCLDLPINVGGTIGALFEIRDDALYVTDHAGNEPREYRCDEAGSLPDGSYALTLHCEAHPTYQHQIIHVVPAGTV